MRSTPSTRRSIAGSRNSPIRRGWKEPSPRSPARADGRIQNFFGGRSVAGERGLDRRHDLPAVGLGDRAADADRAAVEDGFDVRTLEGVESGAEIGEPRSNIAVRVDRDLALELVRAKGSLERLEDGCAGLIVMDGAGGHCQSKIYTACSRIRADWSPTVFAHELTARSAGFDAENRLLLICLDNARGPTAMVCWRLDRRELASRI